MSAIVRRNQGWMPSVFNELLSTAPWVEMRSGGVTPAINVKETKDDYVVEVAAPGMSKEDFNVHLNDQNDLVISMERKTECCKDEKECHYLRREFSYSKFQQTLLLPEDVRRDGIEAHMDRGVLCVHLPKKPESKDHPLARKIDIK